MLAKYLQVNWTDGPTLVPVQETFLSAINSLQQQLKDITAVQIRNKSEVIESTETDVQTTATNYIKTNYSRDPQNFDGLIITVTDKNNDKILYIYSEVSKIWINSGINDVDLSNYYQKSEIDSKIDTINQSITDEVQERTTADNTLQTNINTETERATGAEKANADAITKETNDRTEAVKTVSDNLTTETTNRTNADKTLQTNIDNEVTRAKAAEAANETLINKEIDDRKAAINELSNDVYSLGSGVNAISNDLTKEVERAISKENALESTISNKQDKFARVDISSSYTILTLTETAANKLYLNDRAGDELFLENVATNMEHFTLGGKAIPNVDYVKNSVSNKQDKFATYTVTEGHGILAPDTDVLSIEGKTITLSGNGTSIHSQVTVAPNSTQINGQTVSISSTDGTQITNIVEPTEDTDAVNKEYVDDNITNVSNSINGQIRMFDIYSDSDNYETVKVLIPKETT